MVTHNCAAQALGELLKAVEEGNVKRAVFYLDRGMDPNTTNADGNTILMIASRHGYTDLASMLIARKASLTKQSPAGDTALLMASLGGHLGVVKLLVAAGAPVQTAKGWQPVHYAAFAGVTDILRFLLEHGADKNALAPNLYTPLMLAVRNGHLEAAKVLLKDDVDVSHQGPAGETALGIAQRQNDTDLVELLKRAGAVK
jgi:hypothetical protein